MITIRNANKVSATTDLDRTLNQQPNNMKSYNFLSAVFKNLCYNLCIHFYSIKIRSTPFMSQNLLTLPPPFFPPLY